MTDDAHTTHQSEPSAGLRTGDRPPHRRNLWKFRFAAVTLGVMVCIALLEITFRILGIQGHYPTPQQDTIYTRPGYEEKPSLAFYPFARWRSTYADDPRGYFGPGNFVEYNFNSVGWRDTEHEFAKPPGIYRILTLGDSYGMGWGVRDDDVCARVLERLLNKHSNAAASTPRFEIINASLAGLNTYGERMVLEHRGLKYHPDLVIVQFVLNDVEADVRAAGPKLEFWKEYTELFQTPDTMSHVSYIWSWTRQKLLRQFIARRYLEECRTSFAPDSPKWQDCAKELLAIRDLCQEHDAKLLVAVFPFFHDLKGNYPFAAVHDTVSTFCKTNQIDTIDLRQAFVDAQTGDDSRIWWVHPTDQHPNQQAHAVAAARIAQWITAHR